MTIKKRNDLASIATVSVPETISKLTRAEQYIRDNKPDEALGCISEALIHLDRMSEAYVEAQAERAAEEGGHLVGED